MLSAGWAVRGRVDAVIYSLLENKDSEISMAKLHVSPRCRMRRKGGGWFQGNIKRFFPLVLESHAVGNWFSYQPPMLRNVINLDKAVYSGFWYHVRKYMVRPHGLKLVIIGICSGE